MPDTVTDTSAPASVDTVRVVDSNPESYHPSQDDAAGMAVLREARAAAEPPPEADAGESKPNPLPVPAAGGSPAAHDDLSPEDAKLARILNRIQKLEDERNTAQKTLSEREAELARLAERAKFADEYERELSEFAEDPDRLFKRVKWDSDKIKDYVINGPSKTEAATSRTDREMSDLKARLEKFERADAERQQAARIDEFKAGLPKAIEGKNETYPHTLAFYESPKELGDALWGLMEQTYRSSKVELTAEQAAERIESTLASHFERLNRARSKTGTSAPAPSANPPAKSPPTLTNVPPTAATPPNPQSDSDDDDVLLQRAVSQLRKARVA